VYRTQQWRGATLYFIALTFTGREMLKRSLVSICRPVMTHSQRCGLATATSLEWAKALNKPLKETDPEVHAIIEQEKIRQKDSLVLIASENFTSLAVFDALGSVMSNKYSEGYPGARYYGGNENIDKMETLCQQRALDAFNLVSHFTSKM
jgi:hypothetical protein